MIQKVLFHSPSAICCIASLLVEFRLANVGACWGRLHKHNHLTIDRDKEVGD